jgi:hypothetical protein
VSVNVAVAVPLLDAVGVTVVVPHPAEYVGVASVPSL